MTTDRRVKRLENLVEWAVVILAIIGWFSLSYLAGKFFGEWGYVIFFFASFFVGAVIWQLWPKDWAGGDPLK